MPDTPDEPPEAEQVTQPVGRYRGRPVHLAVRASPSLSAEAPEEFAVTLFVPSPDGANVAIARIDTAHTGPHFDRLYLPMDHPLRKDFSVEVVDSRDAQRLLLQDWRSYVAAYDRNQGLPDRARD